MDKLKIHLNDLLRKEATSAQRQGRHLLNIARIYKSRAPHENASLEGNYLLAEASALMERAARIENDED